VSDKIIAYSYLRLSTKIQLKGDGRRRQLDDTIAAADRHGWKLSDQTFHDLGVSAFKGDNLIMGALSNFLKLVEEGKVAKGSVLMVENPDRISREGVTKSVTILMTLLSADIMVYTTADNRLYSGNKESAFLDLITWGIAAERGHDESLRKSQRILKAKEAQRVRARATGHIYSKTCPAWMEVIGKGDSRSFKLKPEVVEIIHLIFKLRLDGWSLYDIVRHLDSSKYEPLKARNKTTAPKMFHVNTIKRWLTSRSVIGEFQPQKYVDGKRADEGEPIPNYYPAIIEEKEFRRVRGTFSESTSGRIPTEMGANLFRGLMECSCGSTLHVSVVKSKSKLKGVERTLAYRKIDCQKSLLKLCTLKRQHYHAVEGLIISSLRNIEWSNLLKTTSDVNESTMETLRKALVTHEDALVDIDKQMGNLIEAITTGGVNVHLQKMLNELTLEHSTLTTQIEANKSHYDDLKSMEHAKSMDSLSISQTLNLVLNQAADADTRIHMANMLNQHISRIVFTPDPYEIRVYDKQAELIATITPLDKKLNHARIVTPNLEWEVEQHFQKNTI
jgi:DNA invertase Pin-like site-specific DNA recombinase